MGCVGTILIINDDPGICAFLAHCFTREGYDVIDADNGAQLLADMRTYSPDLVLLDAALPHADDLAKTLRHSPGERKPEVIMTCCDLDPTPESGPVSIMELDRLIQFAASTMSDRMASVLESELRPS